MSTIVSSFVQDRVSAAQLPTASLISGVPKAWAFFITVGTPAATASFNVASLTDTGVGLATINYTAALSANAAAVASVRNQVGNYDRTTTQPATTSCMVVVLTGPNAPTDMGEVSAVMMGTLA